jgi:hypothetical protein
MAKAAITDYDKNKNGNLDAAELEACPALAESLASIDKNGDKQLSADELTERFAAYQKAAAGAIAVACEVRMNGMPLANATVTFTPEACMLGTIMGGSGTTDKGGILQLNGPSGAPGLPCGLYKITVSQKPNGTTELIPEKYNTKTTLGREVYTDGRSGNLSMTIVIR